MGLILGGELGLRMPVGGVRLVHGKDLSSTAGSRVPAPDLEKQAVNAAGGVVTFM
jgi:hypothetical protein